MVRFASMLLSMTFQCKRVSRLRGVVRAALALGLLSVCAPASAQPPAYTFTRIAHTAQVSDIAGARCLAINTSGTVIFATSGVVWRGNGTALDAIAAANAAGQPVLAACPGLNDAGDVVYAFAFSSPASIALLKRSGQGVSTLARSDAAPFLAESAATTIHSLSETGNTVMAAADGHLYIMPAGTRAYAVGPADPPLTSVLSGTMNASHVVAFHAARLTQGVTRNGLYVGSNVPLVEDGHALVAAVEAAPPAINDSGDVVFVGRLHDGTAHVLSTRDGVNFADHSGSFGIGLSDAFSINNAGQVSFTATSAGSIGIFTGPDPAADKVLAAGDALDGSTVVTARLSSDAINDAGQIVFWAELADGRTGIYRANPVVAPLANDGTLSVAANTTASGTLAATDSAGLPLIYEIVGNGARGTATITDSAAGTYTYVPRPGQVGSDTFTFRVSNGVLYSNVAATAVTISGGAAGNSPPVAESTASGPSASVRFDNVGDELYRTTDLPSVTSFTMMGWFRYISATNEYSSFMRYGDATTSDGYNVLRCCGGAADNELFIWTGAGIVSGGKISPGTWYHLALTVSGTGPGDVKLYRDGVLVRTVNGNPNVTPERLSIGNDAHHEWLHGDAAAVKVYRTAFTQAEIVKEMGQFAPVRLDELDSWYALQTAESAPIDFSGRDRTLVSTGALATSPVGPPIPANVTNVGTAFTGTLHATDADGDPLTYSIVDNGAKGSVVITDPSAGTYVYTPHPNASGGDTFTFKARDGSADSNVARVTIAITPIAVPLTITIGGNGSGSVTSAPGGIVCPGSCAAAFPLGTTVSLTARPATGSIFTGWAGACSGTGTCTLTLGSPQAADATFAISNPDLAVTSITDPPVAASPGSALPLTVVTKNQGTTPGGASNTQIFLSVDDVKSPDDRLLVIMVVPALAADASASLDGAPTIPPSTPIGTYRVLACADGSGVVAETIETNNCLASTGVIELRRPDLAQVSVTDPPANLAAGASFSLTETIENRSQVPVGGSLTRYFLSLDQVKSSGDVLIAINRSVPPLAAGAVSTVTKMVAVSADVPLGSYFLIACADADNALPESDETNNCAASASSTLIGRPDLVETAVSITATSASPGGTFVVTDTVENRGNAPSTGTATRFYLSTDGSKAAGVLLTTRTIGLLQAGATSTGTMTATVPATIAVGTYYVVACADDLGVVVESIEDNNCARTTSTIRIAWADLTVTAASNPPPALGRGATLVISDTVANLAQAAASLSTVRYYLSTDAVKSADDTRLTGSRNITDLAAGASSSATQTLTVPTNAGLGTFYVLVCADDLAAIMESDESNNCLAAATTVVIGVPDLIVTTVSNPPTEIAAGSKFVLTEAVRNDGQVPAGLTTQRYYLSADATKSADDVLTPGWRDIASLAAGATSSATINLTLPATMVTGRYYVLVCADDTARVTEASETNNCLASSANVLVGLPDLVVTAVTNPPAAIGRGASFVVTDTTLNQGQVLSAASIVRYYLSTDAVSSADDTLLGNWRSLGGLASGINTSGSATVVVPSAAPMGASYVLACADDARAVPELSESNNCLASTTTMVVGLPDLILTGLGNLPAALSPGATFAISATLHNQGQVPAAVSTVRYYMSTDPSMSADDLRLSGWWDAAGLNPGTSATGGFNTSIPSTAPMGTYYILGCADDFFRVTESTEDNNCRPSASTVLIGWPDLVSTSITDPPGEVAAGKYFTVTDRVLNQGNVGAGVSRVRYYLSADNSKDAGDIVLSTWRVVNGVAAGATDIGTSTLWIAANTPLAPYFVLACADDLVQVNEGPANEGNNCISSTTMVQVRLPDLVQTFVSSPPATATPGTVFSVTDTVTNQGSINTNYWVTTRYYLSANGTKAGGVLLSGGRTVGPVAPAASNTGTASVTVPTTMAAGTYYLVACADDTNGLLEVTKSNNCAASAVVIVIQ